jgi:hypothetical protein
MGLGEELENKTEVSTAPSEGSPPQPSRVLFFRNTADDQMTEEDVLRCCRDFGHVQSVLLCHNKRHGFVQFDNLTSARLCHDFYLSTMLDPNRPNVEFSFSGRDEITHKRDLSTNPPSRILLLTISNVVYPVTVDVLQQIITPYTTASGMNRCVIFPRSDQVQALVELATLDDAIRVKTTLDGRWLHDVSPGASIYPGANTLQVQYSSMTELHVTKNSTKSYDFTAPPPAEKPLVIHIPKDSRLRGVETPGGVPVCVVRDVPERTKAEDLAALFAVYGNVSHVKIRREQNGTAIVEMQDALRCSLAQMNLQRVPVCGRPLEIEVSSLDRSSVGEPDEEGVSRDFHDMPTYNRHKAHRPAKLYPPSAVLHLSNMPDHTSSDEVLAALRGAGAQVRNFKFLDGLNHIAVVHCASLGNAVQVLCAAHNVPIGTPSRLLRVGFGAFKP